MNYTIKETSFMTWRDRNNPNDYTNYAVNFSGNPNRDNKFHSYTRKAKIIIPEELAEEFQSYGIWVGLTRPKEGEEEGFTPTYYTEVKLNYNPNFAEDRQPKVYIVEPGCEPTLLNEDSVVNVDILADSGAIEYVDIDVRRSYSKVREKWSLYVDTMYVVKRNENRDPFRDKYWSLEEAETAPF